MTDQTDREQESQETEETKFQREVDEEARRRHEAAERLKQGIAPPDDSA